MKQPQQLSLGRQSLFLALALVILNLIFLIPFLGIVIVFVLLAMGIGGWAIWIYLQSREKGTHQ